jgi:hypothetical protein
MSEQQVSGQRASELRMSAQPKDDRRWQEFCAFAPTGGMPVRGDTLWPPGTAHDHWLGRLRARRMAQRIANGLRRELPGILVDDEPVVVGGVWTVRLVVPAGIVTGELLAGTVAENVPWLADEAPGRLRVPFSLHYDDEQQDQLVLVGAKVIHYLRQTG